MTMNDSRRRIQMASLTQRAEFVNLCLGPVEGTIALFAPPLPTSEVRNADTFGVLKMTLHPGGYEWEFIPEGGKTFRDSGTDSCH